MMRDQLRMSDHTISAYCRDAATFIDFLKTHLGHEPYGADFTALHVRDVRAFMAARRNEGVSARSLNRTLSALRHFVDYLQSRNMEISSAFSALSGRKPAPDCRARWLKMMWRGSFNAPRHAAT